VAVVNIGDNDILLPSQYGVANGDVHEVTEDRLGVDDIDNLTTGGVGELQVQEKS
jgi:hypothetical protein